VNRSKGYKVFLLDYDLLRVGPAPPRSVARVPVGTASLI
jgi:hypothetical protein